MFGGMGLYREGVMFGLVSGDELFLKSDAETACRFRDAGSRPFSFQRAGKRIETSYWSLPDAALHDSEALKVWAALACAAARRSGRAGAAVD